MTSEEAFILKHFRYQQMLIVVLANFLDPLLAFRHCHGRSEQIFLSWRKTKSGYATLLLRSQIPIWHGSNARTFRKFIHDCAVGKSTAQGTNDAVVNHVLV